MGVVRGLGSRLAAALAVALVMLVVGSDAGQATAAPTAGTTVTYRDAVGEDPSAPDITTVVVTSAAADNLSFRVDIPSRPTLTEDMRIRIWLDSDDDLSTGLTVQGLRGLDDFVLVDRWELGLGVARLFTCTESTCSSGPQVGFRYAGGGAFSVRAADLRIERRQRLRFRIESSSGWVFDPVKGYDFTNVHRDAAPSPDGFWTFDMRPLVVKSFAATPARPHAGSRYALSLSVVRTSTGALARGRVACSFRVGGNSLRPAKTRSVSGRAVCSFDIPLTARGKKYRSSISVVVGRYRIGRSVAGTIR